MKAIERLYQYIDYKGVKPVPFEKEIGLSNGYLSKQLKRNADLGEGVLLKLIENCPEIDPEWLLTGNGQMLKTKNENFVVNLSDHKNDHANDQKRKVEKRYTNESHDIVAEPQEPYGVPLIPIDAMAGFGTGSVQVMDYDAETYVVPEFTELKVDFMIRVKGSSMYPKYNSGDLVACKKLLLNDIFFQWNKVYVLDTEQGALIKRVKKSEKPKCITLVSENASYDAFELSLSEIHAIALVVGVIRLE